MKTKTKFKVGDKVRILPSAVAGGVSKKAVGKMGRITKYCANGRYFDVTMCRGQDSRPNAHLPWAVYPDQIKLAILPGQQLLLWDDVLEER